MARRLLPSLLLALAAVAHADPQPAAVPRATDQTIGLPAASSATASGASSTLLNPAGLGFTGGFELDYLHQRSVQNDRLADGAYLAADTGGLALGFSMEWVRFGTGPSFRRTTYALALGGDTLALGAAYHLYGGSDSALFDHLDSWDVGVQARPFRFISAGLSILDADAPRVGRLSLPRRYDVGVGLRPVGEKLSLSADLVVDDNAGFDGAALLYALHWRLFEGMTLFGGLTHYYNRDQLAGTVGITLDTAHAGLTYAAGADSGLNQLDHTVGLRLSSNRYPALSQGAQFAVLDLNDLLSDKGGLLAAAFGNRGADPYLSVLALLRRAKSDTALAGVVLKFGDVEASFGAGHVLELRQAIAALRAAGKPVIALLSDADDSDLFLASACDRIYAVPEATMLINGLSWDTLFLGEALGRIGVRVDVARVGAYKNAPDQLTRSDMSDAQREAEETFLKTVYGEYQTAVTTGRKLEASKFDEALSHGILTAQQAKDAGLIDGIAFPDELNELCTTLLGRRAGTVRDYAEWESVPDRWGSLPRLGLVRIAGTITEGRSVSGLGEATAGADTIIHGIEAARDDDAVKAIVIRVDSGGGSGNASNLIERAIEKAREKKPVVISMGNTAASGGYYVAVGADAIWAEPTTLTGSIGVFVIKPDLSGLLEKLSLHDVTLKQGERADIFGLTKPWSEGELAAMQGYVDAFYDRFITLVAQRRKLTKDQVDQVARGRIWSGTDAKRLGLIDQLGSLDDAIRDAKTRAGLEADERVELLSFGAKQGLLPEGLLEAQSQSDVKATLQELGLDGTMREVSSSLLLARMPGTVAALPFTYRLR